MKKLLPTALVILMLMATGAGASEALTIGRVHYDGGGDWYSDATSLPNLLTALRERVQIATRDEEAIVRLDGADALMHPILYMTGHGTIRLSDNDVDLLRTYLERGGFLWADDNYGFDESFREEIARVFPQSAMVELPFDHPIFSAYYTFQEGLPKIHEHDGQRPQLFGIYHEGRLVMVYSYESDLGDGLESEGVHPEDSPEVREQALRMAINIVMHALSN